MRKSASLGLRSNATIISYTKNLQICLGSTSITFKLLNVSSNGPENPFCLYDYENSVTNSDYVNIFLFLNIEQDINKYVY